MILGVGDNFLITKQLGSWGVLGESDCFFSFMVSYSKYIALDYSLRTFRKQFSLKGVNGIRAC